MLPPAAAIPPALQIFQRAQRTWEARTLRPYVEFDVQIAHRNAAGKMTTGREHVLLRTFDHWCATRELDSDWHAPQTTIGAPCVGPAASPLGFNISSQYPTSTQLDPFQNALPVIADVRALHYDVTLAGDEIVENRRAYHLLLRPVDNPNFYPLRAVWVDETSFDVIKLTYAEQYRGWDVAIDYSFRAFPASATWWVWEIDARWDPPRKDTKDLAFQSTLLITNVTFPASVPDSALQHP